MERVLSSRKFVYIHQNIGCFFFVFVYFFFKGSYTLNEFEWQIPFYSDVPFCSEKLCVSYLQVSLSRLERAKVHGLLPHTWHQLSIFCWIDNKSFFFFFSIYYICAVYRQFLNDLPINRTHKKLEYVIILSRKKNVLGEIGFILTKVITNGDRTTPVSL